MTDATLTPNSVFAATAGTERAIVYCRISKDPTGQKAGVERQRADALQLAAREGMGVVEVLVDNDLSASSGKARPGFQKLMRMVTDGDIDVVIVWHPDRLYRQPTELETIINAFETAKVAIRTCVAGNLDLSTPSGRMTARVVGAVARQEVETKTLRVETARRAYRAAGVPQRTRYRLFGFEDDMVTHNRVEAAAIRDVADLLIKTSNVVAACRLLTELGLKTTGGNEWRPNTLRNLMTNPRLKGKIAYKGEIVGTMDGEPILTPTRWESVNAVLRHRERGRQARVSILSGMVFCSQCGHVMHTHARTDKTYGTTRVYKCPTVPPYNGCGRMSISAERLEQMAEEYSKVRLRDPRVQVAINARASQADVAIAKALKDLDEDDAQLKELNELLGKRGQKATRILMAIEEVEERMVETRQKLAAARTTAFEAIEGWPTTVEGRSASVRKALEKLVILPSPAAGGKFVPERVEFHPVPY